MSSDQKSREFQNSNLSEKTQAGPALNIKTLGVFDSGVGGLTVLREIRKRCPHLDYLYLADSSHFPYGEKSEATLKNLVELNCRALKERGADAIVIACNTASSVFTAALSSDLPTFTVIDPAVDEAISVTKTGHIGLIATRATVRGKAYERSLFQRRSNLTFIPQACPLLVPLVEEDMMETQITELTLKRYLRIFIEQKTDTLILGCTHFPFLRDQIQSILGNSVSLVDSARPLAEEIARLTCANENASLGKLKVLSTDISEHFLTLSKRLIAPQTIDSVELITLPE